MVIHRITGWLAAAGIALVVLACGLLAPKTPEPGLAETPAPPPVEATAGAVEAPTQTEALQEGASTSAAIGIAQGASLRVENAQGDRITLSIPPLAISPTVTVTLTAYNSPPVNPIADNLFPGFRLEPDGLRLRRPAALSVELAQPPARPSAMLFYLKQPELALPLGEQALDGARLSAAVNHFSAFLGGQPTLDEAKTQAERAASQPPDPGGDWQYETDLATGMQGWSQAMSSLGDEATAQQAIDAARQRLEQDLACLMDLECFVLPIDQCGEYLQMLMSYHQQANLLGIDPGSPAMQYLEGELTRVLNQCTNRFELEYDHIQTVEVEGATQEIHVTGRVPFWAPIYGVFELGEPLKLEGSGVLQVTMTGQADECVFNGAGNNQVVISGEIEADEMGYPWLLITSSETWYSPYQATITCEGTTAPIPSSPQAVTHQIRMLLEDGYVNEQPHLQAEGHYRWTLHVIHLW